MRKTKKQHETDMVEIIKAHRLVCFTHIFGYYTDLGQAQAYNLKLEKSEAIKAALSKNKAKACNTLFSQWMTSDNATLQLAAYKLCCTDEERAALSTNSAKVELSGTITGCVGEMTNEEIQAELARIKAARERKL